ncbi:MAG TPA: ATP-binding protein [Acidimicrobiia bacterium]
MAITLKSSGDVAANQLRVLVYGQAGAGKTSLIPTLPSPVVLSAEGGLLSISGANVPYVEVTNVTILQEVYQWLTESAEAAQFESVALDSISEIAEVVLANEKATAKDPRQAYGALQDVMGGVIRSFRDLPGKHVYFTAKLEKSQDEMGRILYSPSMPGAKLGQQLPYHFDEVLALRVEKDSEGNTVRSLQCHSDGLWTAKDRSGRLDPWEPADLGHVIKKIQGGA